MNQSCTLLPAVGVLVAACGVLTCCSLTDWYRGFVQAPDADVVAGVRLLLAEVVVATQRAAAKVVVATMCALCPCPAIGAHVDIVTLQ